MTSHLGKFKKHFNHFHVRNTSTIQNTKKHSFQIGSFDQPPAGTLILTSEKKENIVSIFTLYNKNVPSLNPYYNVVDKNKKQTIKNCPKN